MVNWVQPLLYSFLLDAREEDLPSLPVWTGHKKIISAEDQPLHGNGMLRVISVGLMIAAIADPSSLSLSPSPSLIHPSLHPSLPQRRHLSIVLLVACAIHSSFSSAFLSLSVTSSFNSKWHVSIKAHNAHKQQSKGPCNNWPMQGLKVVNMCQLKSDCSC